MKDMIAKGRSIKNVGVDNSNAVLTEQEVNVIRQQYTIPNVTLKELSIKFGVGITAIHRAVNGTSWRHI